MPHYRCYSCMKTFTLDRLFRRVEEGGYCPYCHTMISELNLLGPNTLVLRDARKLTVAPRPLKRKSETPQLKMDVTVESSASGRKEARITLSREPAEIAFPAGCVCVLGAAPRGSGARLSIDDKYRLSFVWQDRRPDQTRLELNELSPATWSHHLTVPPIIPKRRLLTIELRLFDSRGTLMQWDVARVSAGLWLMSHHLMPVCEVFVMQQIHEFRPPPTMMMKPPTSSQPARADRERPRRRVYAQYQEGGQPVGGDQEPQGPVLTEPNPAQGAYHAALKRALPSGVKLTVICAKAKDLWVRDMFFSGNMVGPNKADLTGPVVIENPTKRGTDGEDKVKESVAQSIEQLYTYEQRLPPQVGHDTASSGNFLCCPPTEAYPLGCILVGTDVFSAPKDIMDFTASASLGTEIVKFLGSHHAQPVMSLDTSWLQVGHVDELVTFIPWSGTRLGFKAAVLSHDLATRLLGESGKCPILEGVSATILEASFRYLRYRSSADVLETQWVREVEELVRTKIGQLKKQLGLLGLTKEDIIDPPVLCKNASSKDSALGFLSGVLSGPSASKSGCKFVTPNVVNMLVVTCPKNSILCIPKPYGPAGPDGCVFEIFIRSALKTSGCTVQFIDDFEACHVNAGNIHCSTLELRTPADDRFV